MSASVGRAYSRAGITGVGFTEGALASQAVKAGQDVGERTGEKTVAAWALLG